MNAILPARGVVDAEAGVHAEVEPFASAKPGLGGPKAELGCAAEGAYVEFDGPAGLIPTRICPRNSAMIPTPPD
jgi:hypothetical protein